MRFAFLPKYFLHAVVLAVLIGVSGCATPPPPVIAPPPKPAQSVVTEVLPASSTVARLANEAKALMPLAQSELARNFLAASRNLPAMGVRKIWRTDNQTRYASAERYATLNATERNKLVSVEVDEYRYYYTKFGSPLSYMRPLDVLAGVGVNALTNKRVLDFGYGTIGHLRLWASLGAHVTGVDVDGYLEALYSHAEDQGAFGKGSVTLVHGSFPKDVAVKTRVGDGYDLIISKNTLKRGYLKPERKVDQRLLVNLGVSDEVFLKTLFDTLKPGGKFLIYNVSPKPADKKADYRPWADGRSPFTKEKFEAAGFRVIALDTNDDAVIRAIGKALQWDKNEKGEVIDNLDDNLFALYTLVERPQ